MKQGKIGLCAAAALCVWFSEATAGVAQFAAGHAHSAAVKTDGTLWTWGGSPAKVGTTEWKTVAAGNGHTVAIKKDGTLWAWGDNGDGQLGIGPAKDGTTQSCDKPVQVCTTTQLCPSCSEENEDCDCPCSRHDIQLCADIWTAVAAGEGYSVKMESAYTAAIKSDGTLWMWGGQERRDNREVLIASPKQVGADANWQTVTVGNGHFAAIKKDDGTSDARTLWTWGENWDGQLGDGTEAKKDAPVKIGSAKWKAVSAGFFHTAAIREDGTLWAWGDDENGQLGNGEPMEDSSAPVQVGTAADWKAVAAGADYTVAVKTDGSLWIWGYNNFGLFGDALDLASAPARVGTENDWQDVAAGGYHVLAAKKDGSLWGLGSNIIGQLHETQPIQTSTPTQIGTAADWQKALSGRYHSLALKTDNSLWAWGINYAGELGGGTRRYISGLIQVGTAAWQTGSAGRGYSLAVKPDGTLWGWGDSFFGQLGNDEITKGDPPTQIGAAQWNMVSAAEFSTLAIKNDGTLWAWGYNNQGQLGDGTTEDKHEPVQISTAAWKTVAAGDFHGAAIKDDGTLWTWGSNGCGQLGTGADSKVPVQVCTDQDPETPCDTDWLAVAAGRWHTLALKQDGTLWAWGRNTSGQLGDGTIGDQLIKWNPVWIGTGWKAVSAGGSHSFALKTDDTLWGWGENDGGQIGDETTEDRPSPVKIGIAAWRSVSAGDFHTLAVRSDGTFWAWGWNAAGLLGNGIAREVNPILIFEADQPKSVAFLPAVHLLLLKK